MILFATMVKSFNDDNYKLIETWAKPSAWLNDHSEIAQSSNDELNSLVLTDELLTGKLEILVGSPIEVILESVFEVSIDDDRATHLGVNKGTKGLSRTVWLTSKGKKLIYANTVISIDGTDEKLLQSLKTSKMALGNIALSTELKVNKDNLQIATLTNKEINKGFSLSENEKLLARRSRMFIENNILNASIIEVFHSDIIGLQNND